MAPVPPILWRLIDDAAVFPPGNAALPVAMARHRAHRSSPWAPAIGPLLCNTGHAGELSAVLTEQDWPAEQPLELGLIARPGTDPALVWQSIALLSDEHRVSLVGLEVGCTPAWLTEWSADRLPEGVLLALEVGRDGGQDAALDQVAEQHGQGRAVVAKFRTGPTAAWRWPDEDELAAFIAGATVRRVPFKLTGGLHHGVRGSHPVAGDGPVEENHGVLNVLLATSAALAGAPVDEIAALLAERSADRLTHAVGDLDDLAVRATREAWRSFGCCEVTDPLHELAALGLLDPGLDPAG